MSVPSLRTSREPRLPDAYTYLDYAATAPLCEEAAAALAPYFQPGAASLACQGNPNSLHTSGRNAFAALEAARKSLARSLGAKRPDEIILTSGATEADNAALLGIAEGVSQKRRQRGEGEGGHVIVSAIEHDAVLAPAKRLEALGYEVERLAPNRAGEITARALREALRPDTLLVSVQAANSEVGSVMDIPALAGLAHEAGAFFHTDATQALGKVPVNLQAWDVDAASFSAHKVGGPKGAGALYLKARTPFSAQLLGGGQELGRRSGTQNVAGACGFAAAAAWAQEHRPQEAARLRALRDDLYAYATMLPGVGASVEVSPGSEAYLPNIVSLLVDGFESETLVLRLDALGFAVSGGSACSSHSLEPSHVLRALGIPADAAQGALRVSLGRYTTEADIAALKEALPRALSWG